MEQSKIEEIIDESFSHFIDTMFKFPKNQYDINFEEIFFKGKADLIHRLEKIINKKDKIIDLMAEFIFQNIDVEEDICNSTKVECKQETAQDITCINCIKQYFERKSEE